MSPSKFQHGLREDRQDTAALTSQLRIICLPVFYIVCIFQSCTHLPELMALNYVNNFGLGQCTQFRHLHNSLHFPSPIDSLSSAG